MAVPQKSRTTLLLDLPDDLLYYLCETISASSPAQNVTFDLPRNLASSEKLYLCHFTSTCHHLRALAAPIQFRQATNAGYTSHYEDPFDVFLTSLGRCEYREYVRILDLRLGIPTWREGTIAGLRATLSQDFLPGLRGLRVAIHDSSADSMAQALVAAFATISSSSSSSSPRPLVSVQTLHLSHILALGLAHLFPSCKTLHLSISYTPKDNPAFIHPLLTSLARSYPHVHTLHLPQVRNLHMGQPWTTGVPRDLRGMGAEGIAQFRLIREREKGERASAVAGTAFRDFGELERLRFGILAEFETGDGMTVFERVEGTGEVVRRAGGDGNVVLTADG
ncbi:hypothetical protein LTR86_000123 [Recurvomyces mirabilis]|nr:hypothetical protein LTR86_000123 [Recurvomyces mirabilis]